MKCSGCENSEGQRVIRVERGLHSNSDPVAMICPEMVKHQLVRLLISRTCPRFWSEGHVKHIVLPACCLPSLGSPRDPPHCESPVVQRVGI